MVRPGRAGGNASDVPSRTARWSGSAGHRETVEPLGGCDHLLWVKRPIRAPLENRPCGRGWSNGHATATTSPSRSSSTSTATCATRSRTGSFAMPSGPRTPSSRHSSSPGASSRGCATRNASVLAPSAPRQCLLRGAAPPPTLEHPHQGPAGRRTGRTRPDRLGRRPGRPRSRVRAADAAASRGLRPAPPRRASRWRRSPTSSASPSAR